jgi:hypothetical protein
MRRQGYRKTKKKKVEDVSFMPEPGSDAYEKMIDFMRADLANDMGYSKIIETARKNIEADGRDFNEEFKKWKDAKNG